MSTPTPDPARHRPFADLEAALGACPQPPADRGEVTLLVRRCADGTRETPAHVTLTPAEGLAGDDWLRRPPREPVAQLAVMRTDVAEVIAGGQPLTLFGDNLFVSLDISAENLPEGTRIRVGDAVVVVTPKPHNGCVKFRARFGHDALRFVAAPATRSQNRRGIYWRVVEAGSVGVGAVVAVLSRPSGVERLLRAVYRAFNARDVDVALAAMHPDVDWPNGLDGGRVRGHAAVRAYWSDQWTRISPTVEPIVFHDDTVVDVRQVVRSLTGEVTSDRIVRHAYVIDDGLIRRMDIGEAR